VCDDPKLILQELEALDFTGKGEAFVESRFLTPFLACLVYETHKDYEVVRHGDAGSAFKLHYPPVEKGTQRVKHYNPDYAPKIRKKMFWIIEAKSPKDVPYPFEAKYLVQGLQYCIHPEIQAKYLLISNGMHSAVYDAHGAVFFEKEIYDPILEFKSSELIRRWEKIFNLLSVEKLRTRIEDDLKAMYDKLSLSSLDKTYPQRLLTQIGASAADHARRIDKHVLKLYVEGMDRDRQIWREHMEQLDAAQVFGLMDLPLRAGPRVEGHYFVEKSLAAGATPQEIFNQLTEGFDRQRIFRKLQTWVGLCALHQATCDEKVKARCSELFDLYKDAELPLLNQVECALLRLTRKFSVLSLYPPLRERLQQELAMAPELIRFVRPPTAFGQMYVVELLHNRLIFEKIKVLSDEQLQHDLAELSKTEARIEEDFRMARAKLPDTEREIGGFEFYGIGGKHYAFKNILINSGVEPK